MTAPYVVGLDLSLTATGVADINGTRTIKCGDLRGCDRFSWIVSDIFGDGTVQAADLVVIEGPAYSRALGAGHHEAAGLWWHIVYRLTAHGVPYAVVPPTSLKKYTTGKGNATKPDMRMALFQRAGLDLRDDNQVDAWWLRAAGLDHLGSPPVELPQGAA
ncbi:MAG: Holliday junction endonuclease [Streptomycetaceae bacterium]|nr:Holliday junction endonuclease [Streptomycetaceae bacterium]